MRRKNFESLMGFLILPLIAVSFALIFMSVRSAAERVSSKTRGAEQARLALTYAVTALRGNDRSGGLNVRELPNSEQTALLVYKTTGGETSAEWLFFADGGLRSFTTAAGDMAFDETFGTVVADVDDFTVKYDESGKLIIIAVSYFYDGVLREEKLSYAPRTTVN